MINAKYSKDKALPCLYPVLAMMIIIAMMISSCSNRFPDIKNATYYSGLEKELILPGTDFPLDEAKFRGACWAMAISRYRSDDVKWRLKEIYVNFDEYELSTQRSFWEAVLTLYPRDFVEEARDFLLSRPMSENYKLSAMACQYLVNSDGGDSSLAFIHDYVIKHIKTQEDYDDYMNDPIFKPWIKHIYKQVQSSDYQELFDIDLGNYPHIFVVFRQNRDYPGIALMRDDKGNWIKEENEILHTRILGRSMSDMYGTITNGNTPQGIYTLLGIGLSDNVFIGPTPTIITGLPIEYPKYDFFHDHDSSLWRMSDYLDMLPPSWKENIHFHEAWYAGMAGRSEIIMHGSTILPKLYKDEPYYPLTPSLGCMTHYEKWSKNGRLIESDQQKIVDALMSCGKQQGFLIVVDIDNEERAVELEDIKNFLK